MATNIHSLNITSDMILQKHSVTLDPPFDGQIKIYAKADDLLYFRVGPNGAETPLGGSLTVLNTAPLVNVGNIATGLSAYSQLQMWSKRLSTDTLPNQTIRWTWYADSNSSVGIGDRTLQLWAYPYSSAVPSSLAIFDQWLRFQYPTFTETTINLVLGSTGGLTVGGRYIITNFGTMTQKHWNIIAGSNNAVYSVGSWFNASLNPATLAPLFGLNTFSTTTTTSSAWTIAVGDKAVYTATSNKLLAWIKNPDGTLQSPLLYQISSDATQIILYSGYLYITKFNYSPSIFYRFPINSDGTLGTREDISTTNIYHYGMAINDKGVYLCGGRKNYSGILKSLEFFPFTNNGSSFGSPSQYEGGDTIFCIIYNNNLYVTAYNYIYKFVINSDGTLGTRTDYATLSNGSATGIVAYNNMLYVSNYNSTTAISAFPINSDGTLGTIQDYFTGSLEARHLSIVNSMLVVSYSNTNEFLGIFPINANGTLGTYTTISTSGQNYNNLVYDVNTNIAYCGGRDIAGSAQQIKTFLPTNGFTGSVISQNYTRKTSIYTDLDVYGNTVISGTLTETSSIKEKENIIQLRAQNNIVEKLNPVMYTRKTSGKPLEIGLIAEEVADLIPELVLFNNNGEPEGIHYTKLSVYLLSVIQQLQAQVHKLESKINGDAP